MGGLGTLPVQNNYCTRPSKSTTCKVRLIIDSSVEELHNQVLHQLYNISVLLGLRQQRV